jgi:UDPglucose 6-dehydrogenase
MRDIYRPLYLIETPLVFTTVQTAEAIKYASNAFLAVKIGYINEIANLCDAVGADVHVVARAMGLDKRIGQKFLHPGPGYGGSCFPKDTTALVALASRHGVSAGIVAAAIEANGRQRALTIEKVARAAGGLRDRTVGVLGVSFKPNTSDIRESPAWNICQDLAKAGVRVRAFDPAAMGEASKAIAAGARPVMLVEDAYAAARDADALVIATEWNEFRGLDLDRIKASMRRAAIVDARNVLDPARVRALGFAYVSTGRGAFGDLMSAEALSVGCVAATKVR